MKFDPFFNIGRDACVIGAIGAEEDVKIPRRSLLILFRTSPSTSLRVSILGFHYGNYMA